MKAKCVYQKPLTFHDLGDGTYHYNYNVKSVIEKDPQTQTETPTFKYDQVIIHGTPTYNKIVAAVIRDKYTIDKELSLINNYNLYQQDAAKQDVKALTEYKTYLAERESIKEFGKKDCADYGILIEE